MSLAHLQALPIKTLRAKQQGTLKNQTVRII